MVSGFPKVSQRFRIELEFQGLWISGFQGFNAYRFEVSWFQGFRISVFHGFRISGSRVSAF